MSKVTAIIVRRTIAALQLLLFAVIAQSAKSNNFNNYKIGFSLKKPASWVFVGNDVITENRKNTKFNDAELDKEIKEHGQRPFVVALQHPEPWPDLNASLQVGFQPLAEYKRKPQTELCNAFLPRYVKAHKDFKIQSPTHAVIINGFKACRISFQYILQTKDGGAFPTWSDLIVIPRGDFFFVVKMGRKPGDSKAAKALEDALKTIEIQK